MNNNKKTIFAVVWFACILGGIYLVNHLAFNEKNEKAVPLPKIDIKMVTDNWTGVMSRVVGPPKGDLKASYTLVEFGDFACPQCAAMRTGIEAVPSTASVNLYFVNRPLPKIADHKYALAAAQAATAAAAQGKFWPMYDALYAHREDLEPYFYEEYANAVGIDGAKVHKEVESKRYEAQVTDSYQFCDKIGIKVTPTVAVRDNKTGKIQVAEGKIQIDALFANAPWKNAAVAGASNKSPLIAKGQ